MERVENLPKSRQLGDSWLGIFVKQPVPGRVKTRLCPPLTFEQAADLYTVALEETIGRMRKGPWRLQLFFAGEEAWFAERFPGLSLAPQAEGDLGERMQQALTRLLQLGERAALIGSDSPDLPLEQVVQAFAALDQHQAVTIPAADGGYVLIGGREKCPPLFEGIPWSSAGVLQATRERVRQKTIDYCEVGGWEDVDDAGSLQRLLSRSPQALTSRHIRRRLAGYLDLSLPIADNRRQL